MDDVSKLVARQYTQYVYPPPFSDIEEQLAKGYVNASDPRYYSALFWPEGQPRKDLNILVAGCGTSQAAVLAYTNRGCTVTGVDLSEPSLTHERYLQEKHGLTNLRLYQGDLRRVNELGQKFDLIVCTGVLHHMQHPEEGLAALKAALAEQGVVILMLYGKARRTGVYLLQDAFRRLGLQQDQTSIALGREILKNLPPHHFVHFYANFAHDVVDDAGFVDAFLHKQDRAYTVPELLQLVDIAGLEFQGWADKFYYYGDAHTELAPLRTRLEALPEREHWAVVENLTLYLGTHYFLARLRNGRQKTYVIDFAGSDWMSYIPVPHPLFRVIEKANAEPERRGKFARAHITFELPAAESFLFGQADGQRTIAETLRHPLFAAHSPDKLTAFARDFFRRMWRLGHMYFLRTRLTEHSEAGSRGGPTTEQPR